MAYDLNLGFRERPKDLDSVLATQGLRLVRTTGPDKECPIQIKQYIGSGESAGIGFSYNDSVYGDENWETVYQKPGIIAQGTISASSRDFELPSGLTGDERALQIGRFLRDHYNAVLEDDEEGILIAD